MRTRSKLIALIFAYGSLGIFLSPRLHAAERIVVIVSKQSPLQRLTPAQVKSLFLGEIRNLDSAGTLTIDERDRNLPIFREFYSAVAAMTPTEVAVHWAKKVFTGEAPPPARLSGDDTAAINELKDKPGNISYIYEKNLKPSSPVRAVTVIEP